MKEPEHNSYFISGHANGRFAASCAPNAGAAEHIPPKADKTIRGLTSFKHQKQFGR
jgi:hypothetical protein